MMPSSTHGDPQLGIDIHLCLVPFTCPLPSLHLSVVFDPFDYLPFIGATVEIAGMKRTTAGTGGIDIHIPPGFPFAPLFPTWDDEIFMGSSTVVADSDPLTYTALPVLGCQVIGMPSPPRLKKRGLRMRLLPTEVNLAIPKSVYVGGSPTISLMGMAMRAGFKLGARGIFAGFGKLAKSRAGKWLGRAFKKGRQKLFKNMKPGFLKCKVLRAEPVNILTGEVSVEQSDFTLPGRIPIEWVRSYASNQRRKGACGVGWETPADGRLEFDLTDGSVIFHYPDEGPAIFPQRPDAEGDEAAVLELMDGALLSDHGDEWRVRTKSDLIYHFPKSLAWTVEKDLEEVPLGRISDLCGNWLEFQRRGNRLVAIRESAERYLRFEYDDGFINTITLYVPASDFTHKFVSYEHDETGNLTSVRDALENPYTFAYDNHHMVQHTNRVGLSFYYEYDKSGEDWRVVHSWGDGGLYDYHFEYWLEINETRFTDSLGHVTTVKYNEMELPIIEIDPLGGRTIFEYDEVGRTTAIINPANHKTEYHYDTRGNLLALIQPDGATTRIEVDKNNKPIIITNPNGATWRQEWDERGLISKEMSPLGAVTQYQYDEGGLLINIKEDDLKSTSYNYDSSGHLASICIDNKVNNRFHVDELGNVLTHTNSNGMREKCTYDRKGRITKVTSTNDSEVICRYDANDSLVEYQNELGAITKYDYVGLGMISRRVGANGEEVNYTYDSEEQLICLLNQRGETYKIKRDASGKITETIDFWGQKSSYRYNTAGHLEETCDPLGQTIEFTTDKLGRIRKKSFFPPDRPEKLFEELFEYDAMGNLIKCSNEHITIMRTFNCENHLLEEKQGQYVVRNCYDKLGRRTRRETSHGNIVTFSFDSYGRHASILINEKSALRIERNLSGQPVKQFRGARLEQECSYNDDGRLITQGIKDNASWLIRNDYEYDTAGNLVRRTDLARGTDHYQYDLIGQVIKHINPKGEQRKYIQDPAGDRLITRIIETQSQHVIGGEDIPGTWIREGIYNNVRYCFDRAGNMTEKEQVAQNELDRNEHKSIRLTWDVNKRLVSTEADGVITKYGYDPLGRRIFKKSSTQCTQFGWDDDLLLSHEVHDNPPEEQYTSQHNNDPSRQNWRSDTQYQEYLYHPVNFNPLALIEEGSVYHYYTEPNGVPIRIFREDGSIAWSGSCDIWGRTTSDINEINNPLRFLGQYYDAETDLCYNRYRYYDSNIGQYISQDPIGLVGNDNLYTYAPNPLAWVDPFGLAVRPGGARTLDTGIHEELSPGINRAQGHRNIRADGFVQSHHPVQDMWGKENIPGYDSNKAPSLLLRSSSGETHARISALQRADRRALDQLQGGRWGSTTLKQEIRKGYKQMIEAGVPAKTARRAIGKSYKYFSGLGCGL